MLRLVSHGDCDTGNLLFADDSIVSVVEAARALDLHGIRFTTAEALASELEDLLPHQENV